MSEKVRKERKPREPREHVYLLTCLEYVQEFSAATETVAVEAARKLLVSAEVGTYLLTKQLASLTVSLEEPKKTVRRA